MMGRSGGAAPALAVGGTKMGSWSNAAKEFKLTIDMFPEDLHEILRESESAYTRGCMRPHALYARASARSRRARVCRLPCARSPARPAPRTLAPSRLLTRRACYAPR